eukprot:maker-scaffold205_size259573-snap-gene-1.45 protein:Tk01396 transcript:maker-scaffold205_size259573-snap-gene-1.45-mRNA-1 annotation:"hypothetical protein DAPPUDRAFT_304267"
MTEVFRTLKERFGHYLGLQNQISAATAASLGFFTAGMVRAWASPAIPSLQGTDSLVGNVTDYSLSYAPLSKEELSWITGLAPLGALFGGLFASIPLARLGRRLTMIISSFLFVAAFLLLGASSNIESLISIFVARGLMGFSVGLSIPAAQIYVSECSESRIRGTLASFPALFMALGTLLTYVVGAYLPWNYLSYFCVAFPVLLLLGMLLMPESPSWLLTKGQEDRAHDSLTWLRGNKNVNKEFTVMRDNIQRSQQEQALDTEDPYHVPKSAFISRSVLVPFALSLALMFFQQWCGVNAVIFYTVTIFDAAGSTVEKNLATIIVGIVQFLATFVPFMMDLTQMDFATLSRSLTGYKSHLTRQINSLNKLIEFASVTGPSALITNELQDALGKAKIAFSKVEEILGYLEIAEPEKAETYQAALTSEQDRLDTQTRLILQAIATRTDVAHDSPRLNASQPPLSDRQYKPNQALKPFTLNRDHTPVEMRAWVNKFKAYYSSSHMDKLSIPEQHAYFTICIDDYLVTRLRDQMLPSTTIYGDDGCISLLEEEFLQSYPMFARRLDFFRYSQASGQLFTDWSAELRSKGDEADLSGLRVEDLYMMRDLPLVSGRRMGTKMQLQNATLE